MLTASEDLGTIVDELPVDANLPGDSQGETNGIYTGVTIPPGMNGGDAPPPDGYEYLYANPGTDSEFLNRLIGDIKGVTSAVQTYNAGKTSTAIANARNQQAIRAAQQPTLFQSFQQLGPWEKLGAIASLIAVVIFLKKA